MKNSSITFVVALSVLGIALALPEPIFPGVPPAVAATPSASNLQQALDFAHATIKKAGDDAETAARIAQARVNAALDTIKASLAEAQQHAANVANIGNAYNVSSQVASVVNTATNNFSECLAARNSEFLNLTVQTGRDIVACVTDKIKEAEDIVKDVIKLAGEAALVGPNAVAAIQKCPNNSFLDLIPRLLCIAGEANKATAESLRIVLALGTNVARATALVATLQVDLQRCAVLRVLGFVLKAGQVAGAVGLCVIQGLL